MPEDTSIIKIIQKMVQENEPEENILKTLESMGVYPDQAKRLLLIAQADTFTLLSSEIDKIVEEKLLMQKEAIKTESSIFVTNLIDEKKKEMKAEVERDFLRYKTDVYDQEKKFQSNIMESVSKVAKLNEQVYAMAEENNKMIEIVNRDLSETKLKGIKVRRSIARIGVLIFGIICFIATLITLGYFVLYNANIDYVTAAVIMALIGTALTYLGANI